MSPCSVRRIESRHAEDQGLDTRTDRQLNAESEDVADLAALVATAGPELGRDPINSEATERRYARRRRRQAAQEAKEVRENAWQAEEAIGRLT